jgi:vancomycin resistance protein VanJ
VPGLPSHAVCTSGEVDCTILRVMTYNIEGLPKPDISSDIVAIRESDADIIAIQEMSPEVTAAIEAELSEGYPYQVLSPLGIPGGGMLSKYPFDEVKEKLDVGNSFFGLRVVVTINGVPMTVITTHPPPPALQVPYGYVIQGRDKIMALAEQAAGQHATLILGDFNVVDQTQDYQIMIEAGYADAFREAGWGFGSTWPSNKKRVEFIPPLTRIDYIWYSPDFRAIRTWVGPASATDHLPVIADLVYVP